MLILPETLLLDSIHSYVGLTKDAVMSLSNQLSGSSSDVQRATHSALLPATITVRDFGTGLAGETALR